MHADDGSLVTSESLAGRRYVLYFYPKDDTTGCTAQACSLRDNWSVAEALDAEIFGVSPDSVASHVKFRDKYGLKHRLLSDEGHQVADAYGTWVEKSYMRAEVQRRRADELRHRCRRPGRARPAPGQADRAPGQLVEVLTG